MTMAAFYLRRGEFPHVGSFNVTFVDWDWDEVGPETGVIAGHPRLDVSRSVPLSVRVRTWSNSYAVARWHRFCCIFLQTGGWLTADFAPLANFSK